MGFELLIFKVTFFYNLFEFCSLNMIIPPWYFTPFTPRCLHKSMFSSFCSILYPTVFHKPKSMNVGEDAF